MLRKPVDQLINDLTLLNRLTKIDLTLLNIGESISFSIKIATAKIDAKIMMVSNMVEYL